MENKVTGSPVVDKDIGKIIEINSEFATRINNIEFSFLQKRPTLPPHYTPDSARLQLFLDIFKILDGAISDNIANKNT